MNRKSPIGRLALATVFLCAAMRLAPVLAWEASIGQFTGHGDVGSPKLSGAATYNAVSQEYTIAGAGVNMWGPRDEFHIISKEVRGDFIFQARVEFIGKGVEAHRKIGLIVRSSLEPDSAYADAAVHGDGLTSLQFRRTKGAPTEEVKSPASGPDVIQLERKGDTYSFSAAKFGDLFKTVQLTNLALGTDVQVGLFLCSHHSNVIERAVFRDVRLLRPAKDNFIPYRDYIGSHLEVLDIQTGHRQLLSSSAQPFEAPNWTPDGSALIYNGSGRSTNRGRIFRFDLATRQATRIDTGFANRNNNDHVLSPDGTLLGISNHSTNSGGRSAIFTVPVQGGTPTLITPLAPSYLHGWSPDGQSLLYTAERNGDYDVYRIPAQGGTEVRLTDAKGLDDGPEYTPDGRMIYFNSVRSGSMQLWRMKADGSNPEQITNDDFQNWFPHISPDGRWVAFLSFPKETDPSDHPYYRRVYIRLLPLEGGPSKVIAYVYGGQGTLNVPSWSPDSTMLAFVSNADLD